MKDFGLDGDLTYPNLVLTKDGEGLCINEYLLKIAENPHTQVCYLQDDIPVLREEPLNPAYVSRDNKIDEYVHMKTNPQSDAKSRYHGFLQTDVITTIQPAFRRLYRRERQSYEFPYEFE